MLFPEQEFFMQGDTAVLKTLKRKKETGYAACAQVLTVPVGEILPNPDQPRRDFSYAELLELAQSIGENGLLNPISITFREGKPVLVAGERRLRAVKMLGLSTIACIEVTADDRQRAVLSLIENLQRQQMNCFETAEGIRRLIQVYGLTQEEAAGRLGCSQSAVANRLRLLRLPPEERRIIVENGLSERHARALLALEEESTRRAVLTRVVQQHLTVAQTEQLIASIAEPRTRAVPARAPIVRDVRVFVNTVTHAVETMRRSGVEANVDKTETDEYIQYVVRIAK